MLQYVSKDTHDDVWYFSAYDQHWDDATLKELWEEHNIIFMPDGKDAVHPVMIIEREEERPLIVIGVEDDGTLYFDRRYGQFKHAFDSYWIDSLVRTLLKAREEIKGGKQRTNREVLNEMSNYELAKFLDHIDCGQCIYNEDPVPTPHCQPGTKCVEGICLWLEAEAKPLMTGMLEEET